MKDKYNCAYAKTTSLKIIEELTAKLKRDSSNSNRPSSTDNIFGEKKRKTKTEKPKKGKPSARKGHKGHSQTMLEPAETQPPDPCESAGARNLATFGDTTSTSISNCPKSSCP